MPSKHELVTMPRFFQMLPVDLMANIAFYLSKWDEVIYFVEMLRPTHDLGPLEHLWKLRFEHYWDPNALWPSLILTKQARSYAKSGEEDQVLEHLAAIIKLYYQVMVDHTTDADWVARHIGPNTCVAWNPNFWSGNVDDIAKWKSCRINRFVGNTKQLIEAHPFLPFLEEITSFFLSASSGVDMFRLAASCQSIQYLDLRTYNLPRHEHCTITTSLANDFLEWSLSRPVRVFRVGEFTWENDSDRQKIFTSVLQHTALENFEFLEFDDNTSKFEATYNRRTSELCLAFSIFCPQNPEYSMDRFTSYLDFFGHLLEKSVKKLRLHSIDSIGFETAWTILTPMLDHSNVEELDIQECRLTTARMNQVVDSIQNLSRLEKISVGSYVDYDGVVALIKGSPVSVRRIALDREVDLPSDQWQIFQELASGRSIQLIHRDI